MAVTTGGSIEETATMKLTVEVEEEEDGRWLAEILELSGVMAYGHSRQEAIEQAQALALRVIADRLNHGDEVPDLGSLFSVVP
jgi:predicted RNase H-like HicB family nuclease